MGRLNAILMILLVACAISVITSQHQARKAFIDLEREQLAAQKLDEEWKQLQLEQSTWATHKRIVSVASSQLGMRMPEPATTVIVATPAGAAK